MSRAGRRHGNCRVFKIQGLREEESEEGGRRRNECRAEWQSGGANLEGGEDKINLKSLREGGNRTQGHGLVESSRDATVAGGRGWAETARLM
jgi:hypothetical protein